MGVDEECRLVIRPDGQTALTALGSGEVQILPERKET